MRFSLFSSGVSEIRDRCEINEEGEENKFI